jgi:rubrerythrin
VDNPSVTTAATIRFSELLEDRSSAFYNELAGRCPEKADTFLAFATESIKNKTLVTRTYQETISDAYEASYSFEGLVLEEYVVDTELAKGASLAEGLKTAIGLEEKACAFYLDVAARSEALLATIPRAFKQAAKKRDRRRSKLESLLEETTAGS